ncbi:MAG: hypothetical protein Fur0039_19660 [Rhodocyclaceae bacterium]
MKYVERTLAASLLRAAAAFPAIVLTGPRRSGKTTLLQHCFPDAGYLLLEAPDVVARVRSDPRSVLAEIGRPSSTGSRTRPSC